MTSRAMMQTHRFNAARRSAGVVQDGSWGWSVPAKRSKAQSRLVAVGISNGFRIPAEARRASFRFPLNVVQYPLRGFPQVHQAGHLSILVS